MPGGRYDSSKTRAQPLFDAAQALSGDWVRTLLTLPAHGHPEARVPDEVDLSYQKGWWQPNERPLRPPPSLLEWLVRNAGSLEIREDESETGVRRGRLKAGHSEAVAEALRLIEAGGADRGWHIFEGPTYPDAVLETPHALIVIEGKRAEAGPTLATTYMDGRHQLWRHVDAAWEVRGARRVFGLFIVEDEAGALPGRWKDAAEETLSSRALASSFPHRSEEERSAFARCFLGVTTWRSACQALGIDPCVLVDELPKPTLPR